MKNEKIEKRPTARMLLGKRGEDVACRFLEGLGHRILARNYRSGHLEIDIISTDGNGVHFVEVKSRVAPVAVSPEENVTPRKQDRIVKAALKFLHGPKEHSIYGSAEVFFDIVAVIFDKGEETVEWFPNAFVPMYF
ncbi:MAG: YraN family protein [Bacteroidales bacterium]|nr:YraN family protein [Bacteroidales bacterium]